MNYLALYRKYRPHTFKEIVGQDHIVKTLQNQIRTKRIAHAYLFCGSRGTGKTSIAKIFAKAVNCERPIEGSSCGECDTCKKINAGAAINIIEMDAASHNGVDNIREINEEVRYTPAFGKYKVYIIDEVHMLSTGAFNALLKTLEEPPAHVLFILATTDPQKIPVTILSRCQRFDFKRIMSKDIKHTLEGYMEKEEVDIEKEALAYIARLADGGMRDALSLLEQCIAFYYKEHITLEKVLYLVGAVDNQILFDMLDSIVTHNTKRALILCEKINNEGRSIKQFVVDFLSHLRNLLVVKTTNGEAGVLDYSKEYINELIEQAKTLTVEDMMSYIKSFSALEVELKSTLSPRLLLEIAVVKLCELSVVEDSSTLVEKVRILEQKVEQLAKQRPVTITENKQPQPSKEIVPTRIPKAIPEDIKKLVKQWPSIQQKLGQAAWAIFQSARAGFIEEDIFYIVYKKGMEHGVLSHLKELENVLLEVAGKQVNVRPISADEYARKCIEVYGSNPEDTQDVKDIAKVIEEVEADLNFPIHIQ